MMPRLKHPAVVFTITTLSLAFAAVLIAQPGGHSPPPPHEHRQPGSQRASKEPLPAPQVTITERDGYRYITSNGLPDHRPGRFPNQGNPNAISAQDYEYRVPLNPETLDEAIPMRGYLFGVALNGVPFDPGTAEIWTPEGRRMPKIMVGTMTRCRAGLILGSMRITRTSSRQEHITTTACRRG